MLKKVLRLRKWEVERVLKKGQEKKIGFFIVKYLKNRHGFHRWNVVLSRRFAQKAVDRNKKRRQIYEAIRHIELEEKDKQTEAGYDIALIPFKKILTCKYSIITHHINDILIEINSLI